MSALLLLDHLVIRVADLAAATADFGTLGFNVLPGGRHETWESSNAIVPLADGSYLELITFPGPLQGTSLMERFSELQHSGHSRIECRVLSWAAAHEGLVDWALLPADAVTEIGRLKRHGIDYEGPLPGMRLRPDAREVRWLMGVPSARDLPFLCGDVTPRHLRVPEESDHANGVSGVAEVVVAVEDMAVGRRTYQRLLGVDAEGEAGVHNGSDGDMSTALFRCGDTTIRLVASADPHSPLGNHLRQRGQGVFKVSLKALKPGVLDTALLHGAAIQVATDVACTTDSEEVGWQHQ